MWLGPGDVIDEGEGIWASYAIVRPLHEKARYDPAMGSGISGVIASLVLVIKQHQFVCARRNPGVVGVSLIEPP